MAEVILCLQRLSQDLGPWGSQFQYLGEPTKPLLIGRRSRKAEQIFLMHYLRRQPADFFRRHAVDFCNFTDSGSETETVLVRHHRGLALAVLLEYPFQNTVALVPGKIDVDVRWVFTAWIKKTFEEEVVFDRIHMGDVEAIGDDRRSDRPAPTGTGCLTNDFLHDQEVMRKTFVPDDRQLFFNSIANSVGDSSVSIMRAGIGHLLERQEDVFIAQSAKRWKDGFAEAPVAVADFGNAEGIFDGFRHVRKLRGHARRGHQPLCGCTAGFFW